MPTTSPSRPTATSFTTENGPGRDMPEELNWLRQGHHYGFPWRMGLDDTPQQFPDYDPATDFLLSPRSTAVREGYYHNDPTYPPTATRFHRSSDQSRTRRRRLPRPSRRPHQGRQQRRCALRQPSPHIARRSDWCSTWTMPSPSRSVATASRSVGLGATQTADSVNGPFNDPSQDLLHLDLTKVGDNYEARVTRIVGGFSNPIDAEIIGNRLYVIEWSGKRGLWEIVLPPAEEFPPASLADAQVFSDLGTQTPTTGVVPYEVNAPFWSDGTTKTRFIRLPPGERIAFASRGPWSFPDETLLIKNFYLDLVRGDPASRRIIETRFLIKRVGYSGLGRL